MAEQLTQINKESLYVSLLSTWYMRHKFKGKIFNKEEGNPFEK